MGCQQPLLLDNQEGGRVLRPRFAQQGVTLIELVIGLIITGILLALAIPSYKDWIQSSQIRTAAESIQNGLQLARAEAVSRNSPVTFTLAGNDWTVVGIQSRSGTEGSTNAVIVASQPSVVFTGLGRITPATAVVINITNPVGGACEAAGGKMRCLNVLVSNSGEIRMCDPKLSLASNPQGCS